MAEEALSVETPLLMGTLEYQWLLRSDTSLQGEDGLNRGHSDEVVPVRLALAAAQTAPMQPGRRSALLLERLIQTVKVPELQMPFGPFGASGTASFSADGQTIYLMALDTGWPVKMDGVTAVRLNVAAEGRQQGADESLELHIAMDDEALSAED